MKNLNELKKACADGVTMALATSVDNVPNVRIVNYAWDEKEPGILYFTSSMDNNKVKEFSTNNKVAICTIPTDLDAGASVRSNDAVAKKSAKTIKDVQGLFLEKTPSFGEALEHMGDTLDVFEVTLKNVIITLDFENTISIDF